MSDAPPLRGSDKVERHVAVRSVETEIGALLLGRVGCTAEQQLAAGRRIMGQLTGNSPAKGPFYSNEEDDRYSAAVRAVHAMLVRAEQGAHPEEVVPTIDELKVVADSRVRLSQSEPLGPPPVGEEVRLPAILQAVIREMREAEGDAVADGDAMAKGVLPSDRHPDPGD